MNHGPVDHAIRNGAITLVVFDVERQRYALPLHDVERIRPGPTPLRQTISRP